MTLPKIAVIALAALLVTAGAAAAMPGEAPDHSGADGHEQASDDRPDDAGDGDDGAADGDASEDAGNASAAGERAQVPDVPASDDADENATERADEHSVVNDDEFAPGAAADEAAADDAAESAGAADAAANATGPAVDLPEQVPDHVSAIHGLVADFLSGDLEGPLGPAVSDVAAADDANENATG